MTSRFSQGRQLDVQASMETMEDAAGMERRKGCRKSRLQARSPVNNA